MKRITGIAVCLLAAAGAYWLVQAGNLEPPGAPAPTMTAADETDPRIPIRESGTTHIPMTSCAPKIEHRSWDSMWSGYGTHIPIIRLYPRTLT